MLNISAPKSVREHAFNLLAISLMLFIAFGCVCGDLGNDNREPRGDNRRGPRLDTENTSEPTNQTNTGTKGRTKVDTRTKEPQRKSETADNGDFQVEYVDVQDSKYDQVNQEMRQEKVLEDAARKLNTALALPHDITLVTRDCGQINAFYNPNDRSITVCYELMDFYYALFQKGGYNQREASQKMADALQFIFLHELGHALIDAYELPVTGNEEDAADKLSSYINIKELGDQGSRASVAAAEAFGLTAKLSQGKELPFYDEHSLDQQRFYNILCQLFGSNPDKYEVLVSKGLIPEPRAVRCPNEFQQNVKAWESLLAKYRKQ